MIQEKEVNVLINGMVGKNAYFEQISKLNDVVFDGDSHISDAIVPSRVGQGDGMSILISDFLTDNDYETAIDCLADKKRDILCIQVLAREELNPQMRGKMHLFDSEDGRKFYRKNIDRDIAQAYKRALAYVTDRIGNYCASRGADYLLAPADATMGQLFFEKMVDMEVLK